MRTDYDFSKGKRGALVPARGKTRISIHIDDAVLDVFRALAEKKGTGYQTMMNKALRQYLSRSSPAPLTKEQLRDVLREEMPQVLRELTTGSRGRAKQGAKHR